MKICPVCHHREMEDNSVFCSECGYRFPTPQASTGLDKKRPRPQASTGQNKVYPSKDMRNPGKSVRPGKIKPADNRDPAYPGSGVSFQNHLEADRPGRPIWPIIAGLIAILLIVGIGVWFFISNQRLEKKQQAEIDEHFSDIEAIYTRQKDQYLDDALKDWKGQDIYDAAKKTKEDENLSNEQKISSLKSNKEEFQTYDDTLAKNQEEQLDKSFDEAKGKYEEEFLIEGEKDKLNQFEKDYDDHTDKRNFKAAKADIEGYADLEKMIMNDEEDPSNFSAKAILVPEEFMPETLDFSVDANTYTVDGKPMSDAHFNLIEQVGEDGEQQYIQDVTVSDLEVDGDEAKYQLTFTPGKPDNYSKNRLYILHVRNADGSKGFTAQQGTNPEKMIQNAAQKYMKDFVDAFNSDCGEDSRVFNEMKDYLEKDSQAYNDYKNLPGLSTVYNEQITDASDTDITVAGKGEYVKITTTFTYIIVRQRSRDTIMANEKEKSFYNNSDNKNFSEEEYYGDTYIVYKNGDGPYKAQIRSGSSTFKVYEYLTEYNTFQLRIDNNTSVGPIYKHENGETNITSVEGMEYLEDPNKEVHDESELYGNDEEDDGYYDDEDYDDGSVY